MPPLRFHLHRAILFTSLSALGLGCARQAGGAAPTADAGDEPMRDADDRAALDAGDDDAHVAESPPPHVATSGHVLVLSSPDQTPVELTVFDLDTGATHDLVDIEAAETPRLARYPLTANQDATTLALLDSDPPWFAHVQDDGFQPLAPARDAAGAGFVFAGFLADGQYALYGLGQPAGFALFDTRSGVMLWRDTIGPIDPAIARVDFDSKVGPHGAFAVVLDLPPRTLVGRIRNGDLTLHELPTGAGLPAFDAEGERAAYAVHDPDHSHSRLAWMALTDGIQHDLGAELPFAVPQLFLPDDAGVVVSVERPAGPATWDLRRFGLEHDLEGTALHDPAGPGIESWVVANDDASLLVVFERQGDDIAVGWLDAFGRRAPSALGKYGRVTVPEARGRSGFSFFTALNEQAPPYTAHSVGFDAQGLPVLRLLGSELENPNSSCTGNLVRGNGNAFAGRFVFGTIFEATVPEDLYVYGNAQNTRRLIVDVAHDPPAHIATLGDGSASISCPVWSPDQRLFAFTSATAAGTQVYVVRRSGSGLAEPELVYERDTAVQVVAAR